MTLSSALLRALGALALAAVVAGGCAERTAGVEPGAHCFEASTDTFSGVVRLTVSSGGDITGESTAAIHDESEGYFTSYRQELEGTASGERLDLEVTTWIEHDRQVARESWRWAAGRLEDGRNVFQAVDCQALEEGR